MTGSAILLPIEGGSEAEVRVKIVEITGSRPNSLDFQVDLYRGNARGSGSYVTGCKVRFHGLLGVQEGKEGTCSFDISKSGYYFAEIDITAYDFWGKEYPDVDEPGQTSQILLNKRATIYPFYRDPVSLKVMTEPRTDWAYTGSIPWTKDDRAKFIKQYSEKYPNNGYNWDGAVTEIHHIRPRQYGGTNDFSNLIPLPKNFHQYTVEGWWDYY